MEKCTLEQTLDTLEKYLRHLEDREAEVREYRRAKEVYNKEWESETMDRLRKHDAWLELHNEGLKVTTVELEKRRGDVQRLEKIVAAKRAAAAGPSAAAAEPSAAAGASEASGPAGGVPPQGAAAAAATGAGSLIGRSFQEKRRERSRSSDSCARSSSPATSAAASRRRPRRPWPWC